MLHTVKKSITYEKVPFETYAKITQRSINRPAVASVIVLNCQNGQWLDG